MDSTINVDESKTNESSTSDKKISHDDAENIIKIRIRQEREASEKREALLKAEKEELRAQLEQMKARNAEQQNSMASNPQTKAARSPTSDELDAEVEKRMEERMQQKEFEAKRSDMQGRVHKAMDEDAEFKKLAMGEGTTHKIPEAAVYEMGHLKNAPAVLKHLLKDPKDYSEFDSIMRAGTLPEFVKFVNNMSDKVDGIISKPKASDYKPAPYLVNSDDSGDDWDTAAYIKSKRRKR